MLSSSLYTWLKVSKRTSPYKPFDYDCATLYVEPNNISSFPCDGETDLNLKALILI